MGLYLQYKLDVWDIGTDCPGPETYQNIKFEFGLRHYQAVLKISVGRLFVIRPKNWPTRISIILITSSPLFLPVVMYWMKSQLTKGSCKKNLCTPTPTSKVGWRERLSHCHTNLWYFWGSLERYCPLKWVDLNKCIGRDRKAMWNNQSKCHYYYYYLIWEAGAHRFLWKSVLSFLFCSRFCMRISVLEYRPIREGVQINI